MALRFTLKPKISIAFIITAFTILATAFSCIAATDDINSGMTFRLTQDTIFGVTREDYKEYGTLKYDGDHAAIEQMIEEGKLVWVKVGMKAFVRITFKRRESSEGIAFCDIDGLREQLIVSFQVLRESGEG